METTGPVSWDFKVDHLNRFATFDVEATGKNPQKCLLHGKQAYIQNDSHSEWKVEAHREEPVVLGRLQR